jgi:predicted nucleotidyltransferase
VVVNRDETVRALRAVLEQEPRLRLALLFGSVARGSATEQSDIDLAVQGDELDVAQLSAALSSALGRETQIVALRDAGVPLLEELLRDGIVVYEQPPHTAASWRARAIADLEIDRPWYARMRDAWLRRVAERGLHDGQP